MIRRSKSRLGVAAGLAIALATLHARADEPSPTAPTATPELPPLPSPTAIPEAPAARASDARGDEPPSPVAVPAAPIAEDARLERFLELETSSGRKGRIHSAVVDTVVIAATVPPGVILITNPDPALELAGLALLIQGGWAVISLPFTLQRTTLETLHDHYEERKARGEPEAERIAETEGEWQRDVAKSRSASTTNAVLDLTLGGLEFAGGLTMLLVNGSVLADDRRTQTFIGSLFVSVSLPAIVEGLWLALGTPGIESQWNLYQAGKPTPSIASARPRLSIAPIRGGATGRLELAF